MTIRTYDQGDLRKRNLLVKASIKRLGHARKDKRASADMCNVEGASEEVAAVIKSIFNPTNPMIKDINRLAGLLRNHHIASTAPWDDNEFRIITAKAYGEYKEKCDAIVSEFMDAVELLISHRDEMVADAKKHLGALFDPKDYPDATQMREAYHAEIITEVIPDRKDIRLDMDEERTQRLVDETIDREQKRIAKVTEHVFKVVRDELEHMNEALGRHGVKNEGDERAKGFRDSLVPRMQKLAGLLPALNIQNDPKLNKLAQEIAGKLCVVDSQDLRKDPNARAEVQGNCEKIIDSLDQYFGGKHDD